MAALIIEILLGFLTLDRQPDGGRQAAGSEVDPAAAGHLPAAEPHQPRCCFWRRAGLGVALALNPTAAWAPRVFPVIIVLALLFGVLLIIPIGGADMPTVIAILNAYAGLAAVAMGFVLDNKLLITAGRARRIERPHPRDHHVQGDEPLVHQRAVRRVRPGAAGQGRRRSSSSLQVGDDRRARRRCSSRPSSW